MAPIRDKLDALASVAETLNNSTNSLNAIIEALEQRLAAMRVGVAVELDNLVAEKHASFENDRDGERVRKLIPGWKLGYSKIGDSWRIVVTRGHREADFSDAENERIEATYCASWEFVEAADPIPLVQAPRLVRVEAVNMLEALITALTQKAAWYAQSIEKAKALTEK